jgi:hypothetical protein
LAPFSNAFNGVLEFIGQYNGKKEIFKFLNPTAPQSEPSLSRHETALA